MKAGDYLIGKIPGLKRYLLAYFLLLVTAAVVFYSGPFIYKYAYDYYIPSANDRLFVKLLGVIFVLNILLIVFKFSDVLMTNVIKFKIRNNVRSAMTVHLIASVFSRFYEYTPGEIINRIIPDTDTLSDYIFNLFKTFCHLTQAIIFFTLLYWLDSTTASFLLALIVVSMCCSGLLHRSLKNTGRITADIRDRYYTYFSFFFSGIKEIKCFNMLGMSKKWLNNILIDDGKINSIISRNNSLILFVYSFPAYICTFFVFITSIKELKTGAMSFGSFITLTALVTYIGYHIVDLSTSFSIVQSGYPSVKRIKELLNFPVEDQSGDVLRKVNGNIEIKKLNFGYKKNVIIFENVNCSFKKNQFVSIIGESGSGKSTLINLILKLYKTDSGTLEIDEKDISGLKTDSIREKIGYMAQTGYLFNTSMRDNIDLTGSLSDKDILNICGMTELSDLVGSLPDGIHSMIYEEGKNLSGGEKQRILLARCLAKEQKVIIIDEATSALDLYTESKVIETLLRLLKDGKVFLIIAITHRPSFVKYSDMILLVENHHVIDVDPNGNSPDGRSKFFDSFDISSKP